MITNLARWQRWCQVSLALTTWIHGVMNGRRKKHLGALLPMPTLPLGACKMLYQSCFRPALCPKVYFSSSVRYCLKCQPPPALPRLSCKVFSPSLHLAWEVGRFWDHSRAFLKLLFPLSGRVWHWVSHCFLVLTLPLQADRWPALREWPFLEGEIEHIN